VWPIRNVRLKTFEIIEFAVAATGRFDDSRKHPLEIHSSSWGHAVKPGLLLAVISGLFIAVPLTANAADIAVKTSAPLPPPSLNWTGCYIGGNGGGTWIKNDSALLAAGVGGPVIPLGPSAGDAAAYGGQIGCDYQSSSNWVVGLRGMWDATTANSSIQGAFGAVGVAISSTLNSQTRSFGTAVARVGYSFTPALMFYGIGGVAFAENKYTQNIVATPPGTVFAFNSSDAPTGWAAGAGASWMLSPNWDFWIEYNYLGFGSRTVTTQGIAPLTNSVRQDVQTVLVGLDFRFTNWAASQFSSR
jgi:outer membrane immunogenic protein